MDEDEGGRGVDGKGRSLGSVCAPGYTTRWANKSSRERGKGLKVEQKILSVEYE